MKLQKISNKGFTLVELMIVVAIIGVLAATLLPQLQGAQARARDAGRAASLQNASAVLETYFSDEGQYPADNGTDADSMAAAANCLSAADGTLKDASVKLLFKWSQAPVNPQKTSTSGNCTIKGAYAYNNLKKDWIERAAYFIASDVESFKKANLNVTASKLWEIKGAPTVSTKTYANVKGWAWGKPTAEATNAKDTMFAIVN